ncbi:MAG TPA: UPF0182 family protein [Gemmatimonadaceae bacterium]|nr:UPF0182 family protein [Gemmatimonadaceae bacterium]
MSNPPFVREIRLPPQRRPPAGLRIAIIAAVLLLLVLPAIAARIGDWLWYREVGYERVFLTKIAAQWTLGLIAGLGGFLLLYVNARVALRGISRKNLHIRDASEWAAAGPKLFVERMAAWFVLPVTLLLGVVLALASAGQWRTLAQFFYRTPFGIQDPVFGRDVMYYVFTIPMLEIVLAFVNALGWIALLMCIVMYVARGDVGAVVGEGRNPWRFYMAPRSQMHLAVIGAVILTTNAVRVLLVHVPALLLARHPVLFGATYTDLELRLPLFRVLAVVMVLAGVALIWQARKAQLARGALIVFATVIGATFLLGGLIPSLFQRLVVQPNELARETPQINHHIAATRQAWNIAGVERRELTADRQLSMRDVDANQITIRNVRLWDREPLLQTYGQIQSIRTYYDFESVDDDRYLINGELRQVLLSPRELNTASLPTRTFINEHLTYTHGMGVTLGPSNQVTAEGLPVLWIKDLPPASTVPIRITRPQIYFGEISNDFILAPSRQREFDYPSGQGDAAVYSSYDGGAGVSIDALWRRILFAFRFGSLNIMLSGDVTPNTRIIFHRNVLERAQLALPFLQFDPDPFMVITDDGRLEWMIDAYTATDRYPYAQPLANGVNYMRNSVKVTVDAYTGDIKAYLSDPNDPMIRTLGRIYPGLLLPMSEMPADLRSHVRYPGTLFAAQSALYATFHMTDPETFYHREDQWQIPVAAASERNREAEAFLRHIVMRLPGEREPEFILMRPFTPRQKDNLAAWMVVRNDGEHYGKLRVYSFPRQSLVFGPAQIVNRINQDTEVAQQISLWDQRGSEVIRGELLVIPIEESLIYVQPLYLRAQGGRIPELKRVVVAHESEVAMEETLEAGLQRLFGGRAAPTLATGAPRPTDTPAAVPGAAPAATGTSAETAQLIRDASAAYERARAAQRAEDWATYGTEMRRLGEILRRLRQ